MPSRIRSAVGHPMLTALMIWAFAHLLANGDLASVLLFGSLLGFAVYDRILRGRPAFAWTARQLPRAGRSTTSW